MFILSLIFALIVTGYGVHGIAISSRSGNVTAIVGYPLTISWTHSFLDSDIDLCYYQSKKKYLDEFVGWSNKNRERLNITDNHRGWDFINEKMPCQDGIRREDAGIHDTGEYKIYVQTTDGQRHEGQWIKVTVVSGSELFYTLTMNETDVTKNVVHQSALPTHQIEDHGLTNLLISLSKAFPRSNITLSAHFENRSHVETLQSCPVSGSCSGNFTSKTDLVQISADIESGIQGFELVRVQQPVLVIEHQTPIVTTYTEHSIVGLVVTVVLLVLFLLLLIILLICLCNKQARHLKKVRKYLLRKHNNSALKDEVKNLRSHLETLTEGGVSLEIANRLLDEKNKELSEEIYGLKKEKETLLNGSQKKTNQARKDVEDLIAERSSLQIANRTLDERNKELSEEMDGLKKNSHLQDQLIDRNKQEALTDRDQHADEVSRLKARIVGLDRVLKEPKEKGNIVHSSKVTLGKKLEFTDTFDDQLLEPSKKLLLNVTFSHRPDMVSWFRDGAELLEGEGTGVTLSTDNCNTYIMRIKAGSVKPGMYLCQARFEYYKGVWSGFLGQLHSELIQHQAKVSIDGRTAPTFRESLHDKKVEEGNRAFLQVEVDGFPPPEFKWYKDGVLLSGTDRMKIEVRKVSQHHLATLTMEQFSVEDAGLIKLIATNDEGSKECSANLSVSG